MDKKYLTTVIIIIILIGLLTFLIKVNNKGYIMQDGVMLALTLDGEKTTSYPEGTNYEVEINCENGKGKWLVDEWKLAVEEITGNVICNINFNSNPKTLISEVEEVNVNNNYDSNGYRYSGNTPSNYIWFNNEMWRIIGSLPTRTPENLVENLVKIIRNETIGSLVYDAIPTSGYLTSSWGTGNTLYKLLNEYYYGALDGTETDYCYGNQNTAKSKCDYTTIGINPEGYYGKMVKNVYWRTQPINYSAVPSVIYTRESARSALGYVGLMTASDYGYAAPSNYHTTSMDSYQTTFVSNWLGGQSTEWTNILYQSYSNYALTINDVGNIDFQRTYFGCNVRPVVYLDPSVYIISGDGTEGNPYQIGM